MVDTSDTSELQIQIAKDVGKSVDFNPHNGKPATIIACSPNGEYIATWCFENRSVVGWKIVDGELQLKHEYMISVDDTIYAKCPELYVHEGIEIDLNKHKDNIRRHLKQNLSSFVSVSDNKLVSMPIYHSLLPFSSFTIGIFDFKTKEQRLQNLPMTNFYVVCLAFLKNSDLVIVGYKRNQSKVYRAYVFTQQNSSELIHKSTIKLDTIENIDYISITITGKIFIYNTSIGNITKWDIMTLKLEAYFLFKPECYDNREIKLSDDELLLFVRGTDSSYSYISIYLAKNGMRFTTYAYDKQIKIDAVYLVASNIGARLLIIAYNEEDKSEIYMLRDPFTFTEPVDAHKFFDCSEDSDMQIQFQYPFIVKSDQIIGFIRTNDENIDKKLIIKELIQDKNNWITFLRQALGDFNRIFMSSVKEQVIEFLENKRIEIDIGISESDILLAKHLKTEKESSICINTRSGLDSKKASFVISCCCLDNDDLVMVTE
ncbi:848_t:CDS:2 [Gigaspora rosea]|nr:848_t:CDS:2 [Gigaspora rosea]